MNFKYSPGLPGYGTKGTDGSTGLLGLSLYFCGYDSTADSVTIKSKILNNKILLSDDELLPGYPDRVYQNGDEFIDENGKVCVIDFTEDSKYRITSQKLNTTGLFVPIIDTISTPKYTRYSNAYDTDKFLVDSVYANTPPGNYIANPSITDTIYGIGAIDFAKVNFVNKAISTYHPYEVFINSVSTTQPERAIAIVKEDGLDNWHFGNVDSLGNIRNVNLFLDFAKVNINSLSNSDYYFEKILPDFTFTAAANRAVNINLGNINFGGELEITIIGNYNNEIGWGQIVKKYGFGGLIGGAISANESQVITVVGNTDTVVALGEIYWTGTQYAIPVSHIGAVINSYYVKVRAFSTYGISTLETNLAISTEYALTALSPNQVNVPGNFGIATKDPSHKLHVIGDIAGSESLKLQNSGLSYLDVINFGETLGGAKTSNLSIGNQSGGGIFFHTNNTSKMFIRTDGYIGIGTTSPDSIVHIEDNVTPQDLTIRCGLGSNNAKLGAIKFVTDNANGYSSIAGWRGSDSVQHSLVFSTMNVSGTPIEAMRILPNGDVSISQDLYLNTAKISELSNKLTIKAGGSTNTVGGILELFAGESGDITNTQGAAVNIYASNGTAGPTTGGGAGGAILIKSGDGASSNDVSGSGGNGGTLVIRGGQGGLGGSYDGAGGSVHIIGGIGGGNTWGYGDVLICGGGTGIGSPTHGKVYLGYNGTNENGQVYIPSGTNVYPSLAFRTSPTTGFYRPANNEIGITLAGAAKWRFTGNNLESEGLGVINPKSLVGAGSSLIINGGASTTSAGGHLFLNGGDGNAQPGNIYIAAGDDGAGNNSGHININVNSSNNGKLYITGLPTGSGNLVYVNHISGEIYQGVPSDERLKTIISPISNIINKINNINSYYFKWNDLAKTTFGIKEDNTEIGVIAQQIEKEFPEMISNTLGKDGSIYKYVQYEKLAIILLPAIKEQQIQINNQQTQINELRDIVNKQQEQIQLLLNKL